MRTGTVSYKLEDLRKGVIIPIGMVGENDFTRVIFDAEEVFKKHPDAQVTMKVQPPKGGIYPATVTRDGNAVIWQVKAADVAHRGSGELQLTFTADTMVEKSYIARTDIKRSLVGNGPAPDPVQDFVDDANEKLAEVDQALDDLAAMDNIAKTAQASDIGKALSPKTVENGVVTEWQYVEPGAGTEDYTDLENKPSIAGVILSGNKTLEDLGIAADDDLDAVAEDVSRALTAIHGKAVALVFDKNCYINSSGEEVSSQTSISTDYIDLNGIKAISYTGTMGSNRIAHWYDNGKTYVGMSLYANDVMQKEINVMDTRPAGAEYVRLTAKISGGYNAFAYYGEHYSNLLLNAIRGDGVTDDTIALSRFIKCGNGALLNPKSKIRITEPIAINPALTKNINGNNAEIIVDGDFYAFSLTGTMTTSSNPSNVSETVMVDEAETKIQNWRITSEDGESGGAIEATKSFKLEISNNYIYKMENGIRIYGHNRDMTICKNNIYAVMQEGIIFDEGVNLHQCNIENNMIQYALCCIHIYPPKAIANFQIIGNDLEISTYPTGYSDALVLFIESSETQDQCSEIEICGNTIQGHSSSPNIIKIAGFSQSKPVADVNITGNHISNSQSRIIFLQNVSCVAISGNTYDNVGGYVYEMDENIDYVVIGSDVAWHVTGGKIKALATADLNSVRCKNVVCKPNGNNSILTSDMTDVDIEDDVSANGVNF